MLDFPRWKITSIIVLLAALSALAIPSFFPESITANWPIQKRVNLGLDLAGGSYLLLEGDTQDFAKSRLTTMRDEVQQEMSTGTPRIDIGDISIRNNQLTFMVRDVSQVDAVRERLLKIAGGGVGMTGQRDWDINVVDSTRFVLTPTKAGLDAAIKTAMGDATEVVRRRIDALGTKEPSIVQEGSDRIVVQVPGLSNPQQLKDLLGKTAKLEFKMVDTEADPAMVAKGIAPVGDVLLPMADNPAQMVALHRQTIISGEMLNNAAQAYDQNNQPDVTIQFNSEGGRRFAKVTQQNVGKPFAIIVDNQIISAPRIDEPILGGSASISGGGFTVETANNLAIALRSGKLPVALKVIEEHTVGSELGTDSIHSGIIASAIALVAVIAFMAVTYGRFGLYADLAVAINLFVILGVMALLSATLTLPGIAGFVLTIGTAVDANVLINERIREERRHGRNVVQAVELGYKEASRTIFEANVTHGIAAFIMLILGSGPIKGFAIVLLLGIATSVFTAVTFTRMLVALWLRRHRPSEIHI